MNESPKGWNDVPLSYILPYFTCAIQERSFIPYCTARKTCTTWSSKNTREFVPKRCTNAREPRAVDAFQTWTFGWLVSSLFHPLTSRLGGVCRKINELLHWPRENGICHNFVTRVRPHHLSAWRSVFSSLHVWLLGSCPLQVQSYVQTKIQTQHHAGHVRLGSDGPNQFCLQYAQPPLAWKFYMNFHMDAAYGCKK